MTRVLLIDNYDSFTYNLVEVLRVVGFSSVEVKRNDKFRMEDVSNFDKVLLSPGPGIPSEAGRMCDLIKEWASKKSILGVCLGHQGIAEVFGARLRNLDDVIHGKALKTTILDSSDPLFVGLPANFLCGRYHSWVVEREGLPQELRVTSEDCAGEIMSLRHSRFDVAGVQFHPESVLTPEGGKILENWVKS